MKEMSTEHIKAKMAFRWYKQFLLIIQWHVSGLIFSSHLRLEIFASARSKLEHF